MDLHNQRKRLLSTVTVRLSLFVIDGPIKKSGVELDVLAPIQDLLMINVPGDKVLRSTDRRPSSYQKTVAPFK
jgi:hypothetical protein